MTNDILQDWFAPNTQNYWDNEFLTFFDPTTGVDIDALWIDLNVSPCFRQNTYIRTCAKPILLGHYADDCSS